MRPGNRDDPRPETIPAQVGDQEPSRAGSAGTRSYSGAVTTLALDIAPVSGAIGAEVHGIDLSGPLSDEAVAAIRRAFNEHQVLFFRDQDLTAEQQLAFGRRFGELGTHPYVDANPQHPEVIDIVTEPDDRTNFGGGWHTDVTFL